MFTWPWKRYQERIKELEKLVEEERKVRAAEHCLHIDAPKEKGQYLGFVDGGVGWSVIGPDQGVLNRLKQVELRFGRDMQGRAFTRPVTEETRSTFTVFQAKNMYPDAEGGPALEGRLTIICSTEASVTESATVSVSKLLDWYMVPVDKELELKAEIKRRMMLLASTEAERREDAERPARRGKKHTKKA